jgi:hypothetical protein
MDWGGRHGYEICHNKKTSQKVMSTKQENNLTSYYAKINIFLSGVDSFQEYTELTT